MWVNIDDVRAELERLVRNELERNEEEFAGKDELDEDLLQFRLGKLFGYISVETMLDRLEHIAREEQKVKNRDKFRDEIIKAIKSRETCEFMNDTVIPEFIGSKTDSKCICEMGDCRACLIRFTLWLDEEYMEPPKSEVDWDNVPVDTLVRVRDEEDEEWILQYFKGVDEKSSGLRYLTWAGGATSKTASGWDYVSWKYCELVED